MQGEKPHCWQLKNGFNNADPVQTNLARCLHSLVLIPNWVICSSVSKIFQAMLEERKCQDNQNSHKIMINQLTLK